MKKVIFLGFFLVVLCIVWTLYLDSEKKRFERSLTIPPHKVSSHTVKDTTLDGSKEADFSEVDFSEVDFSEAIVPPTDAEYAERTDKGSDSEQMSRPEMSLDVEHGHSHEDNSEHPYLGSVDLRPPPGMSLAEWRAILSPAEKQALYLQKPWLKPIEEMTLQEVETEVERRKQRLIDEYGNTPEVQLVSKYITVPALLGESQRMTGDEGVEHARAMSVLWPTQANIDHYRELKSFQENGWHVD